MFLHTATCRFDTMYLKTISLLGFPTCFQWRGEHPNGSEPGNRPENGKNKCTCVYLTFLKDHGYSSGTKNNCLKRYSMVY